MYNTGLRVQQSRFAPENYATALKQLTEKLEKLAKKPWKLIIFSQKVGAEQFLNVFPQVMYCLTYSVNIVLAGNV